MAQLVDDKANGFLTEFESLIYSAAGIVQSNPDWEYLSTSDQQFVLNFLSIMIIQNACSFERRIVRPCQEFPLALLAFARVRHDLPCKRRQQLAQEFLNLGSLGQLDIDSMKILKAYHSDIEVAAESGLCGLSLYIAMKGVRRLFKADVRENERLNKQLKLYGERSPGASLDLISSRLTLKYFLGIVGARQEGLFGTKNKKWSTLRPLASSVMDKCLEHWSDGQTVMAAIDRFAAPSIPDWCPINDDVKKWQQLLRIGLSYRAKTVSVNHLMSAAVNRKLYHFFQETKKSIPSMIQQPCFAGVAFVECQLQQGRPHSLKPGSLVFVFGEVVNRSVRLLGGKWQNGGKLSLDKPWKFEWVTDLVYDKIHKHDWETQNCITIIAFPLSWIGTESGGLEPCLRSKTGIFPFVTITEWEEEPLLNSERF